nr:unnamed protein product [Callosobruchus analis]
MPTRDETEKLKITFACTSTILTKEIVLIAQILHIYKRRKSFRPNSRRDKKVFRYPQIKMYWAKMTKLSSIAGSMTRNRYFQISSNLKVIINADVLENERKVDKFFKIRPPNERIRKGCSSVPRNQEDATDEQMIPSSGMCYMKPFVRGTASTP